MKNSKNKGNHYERVISKKLSLWISNGIRDDLLWRTHNSGGRFTHRFNIGKDTINQSGDITSTSSLSEYFSNKYIIECKSYNDINLWTLFTNKNINNSVLSWWKNNKKKADIINKTLLLIVKQDFKPDLLFTSVEFKIDPIAVFFYKSDKIIVYNLDFLLSKQYIDLI